MHQRPLHNRNRRGFTMVEVLVAAVVTAFVLGSVSMSLSQLGRTRHVSKVRLAAHLRASSALESIRRDIATIIRDDDLFFSRFVLMDDVDIESDFDRDAMLLFNTRLQPVHDIYFNGEGIEYETQYRIEEDDAGPILWQRRDAVPDEFDRGGGTITPLVEGVIGLRIEAFDGIEWFDSWDSDEDGIPLAVRITVTAGGNRDIEDAYEPPLATLRTVVSLERVIPPSDLFRLTPEEEQEIMDFNDEASAEDVAADTPLIGNDGPSTFETPVRSIQEGLNGDAADPREGNNRRGTGQREGPSRERPSSDRKPASRGGGGRGVGGET